MVQVLSEQGTTSASMTLKLHCSMCLAEELACKKN